MRPATGGIHRLPVKVLYSLDSSAESYVTVLTDLQEVYVHPAVPTGSNTQLVGSAYIKPIAWGVCYASPECLPHDNSLDYTVYTMDPMQQSQRISRAFPPSGASSSSASIGPSYNAESSSSWTGRGYLSWALNELGKGSTLIRGRLTRDHDFASNSMNEAGGLEGLVAAAAAREGTANRMGGGKGRRNGAEEADGKAWGLEVVLSLKMVPGAAGQVYLGRKEFVESIARQAQTSRTPDTETARPVATAGQARPQQSKVPAQQANVDAGLQQAMKKSDISAATAYIVSQLSNGTKAKPPEASASRKSAATAASHQAGNKSVAQGPRTAIPEGYDSSSVPMTISSSLQGMPKANGTTAMARQASLPPTPLAPVQHTSTVDVPGRTIRSNLSGNTAADRPAVPAPTKRAADPAPPPPPPPPRPPTDRAREVTPPPAPEPRSPPPSTPRRANLYALLRSDSKMSPGLARQLTNNPELLKLLKGSPASPKGAPVARGDPPSPSKPPPPSTTRPTAPAKAAPPKASPAFCDLQSPTPDSVSKSIGAKQQPCSNCGTFKSRSWLARTDHNGQYCKVCHDCGSYWNLHKRFRPPELWSEDTEQPSAKRPARDSPAAKHPPLPPPIPPVRSSPRRHSATRTGSISSLSAAIAPAPPADSSPRKRKGKNAAAAPPESPRRATRAAAREAEMASAAPTLPVGDTDNNPFMPSMSAAGTQDAQPEAAPVGLDAAPPMSDAEIDALLASFLAVEGGGDTAQDLDGLITQPGGEATAAASGCATGLEGNLTLDQIFSGAFDENGQVSQEVLSLLNSEQNWAAESGQAQ